MRCLGEASLTRRFAAHFTAEEKTKPEKRQLRIVVKVYEVRRGLHCAAGTVTLEAAQRC